MIFFKFWCHQIIFATEYVNLLEDLCSSCQGPIRAQFKLICEQMISSLTEMKHEITRKKNFCIAIEIKLLVLFTKSQWNDVDITCHRLLCVTNSFCPVPFHIVIKLHSFIEVKKEPHSILMLYFSKPQPYNRTLFLLYCASLYLCDFSN